MTPIDPHLARRVALGTGFAAVAALVALVPLAGQAPARVTFDAASVKPNGGSTPGQGSASSPADASPSPTCRCAR